MNLKFIPVVILALSICQPAHSNDPSSLTFKIPEGSTLTLNQDLDIPDGKTHATLQFGKLMTDREKDDYKLNCRFDVKQFGPRTIKPEVFKIRRSEHGEETISEAGIIRFYSDIYLDSDKGTDVIKLTCQEQGGKIDRTFTIAEMDSALGGYFTFKFTKSTSNK